MARSLLFVAGLLALVVCAAAGDADKADDATVEHYKKHYVSPPTYTAFEMCEGGTNEVQAASVAYPNNINSVFRSVNVTCGGAATCTKSGPTDGGCFGSANPYAPGGSLTPTGAVSGATLQVGGRCQVICDTNLGAYSGLQLIDNGWSMGYSTQTSCIASKQDNFNLVSTNCRLVATAVCCVPKKHAHHNSGAYDYSG